MVNIFRLFRIVIGLALLLSGKLISPALAQPGREYVPVPLAGDPETILKGYLNIAKDRDNLFQFMQRMPKDLPKNILAQKFMWFDLKPDDPKIRSMIEEWFKDFPSDFKISPETRKLLENFRNNPDRFDFQKLKNSLDNLTKITPPDTLPAPRGDKLAQWLRQWLENAEASEWGDWLKDSAAWQDAVQDLRKWISPREDKAAVLGLADWIPKIPWPGSSDLPLDNLKGKWLPKLSWPAIPAPRLDLGRLDRWLAPGPISAPRWSIPSGSQWWNVFLWICLVLAGVFLLRKSIRRLKAQPTLPLALNLGPWPVPPDQVATSEQLIAAFEYLALLRLGMEARTWNHRVIAAQLGQDQADRFLAASQLAGIYEAVRYAPEQKSLSNEDLAAARRHLCLLAGVAQ